MGVKTRVALVDDHAVLAEALTMALRYRGHDVEQVPLKPPAPVPWDLVSSIVDVGADVVLLDLDLGAAGDGTRLIRPLTQSGQRVVVLTASGDPVRWGACLAQGALTVLPKTSPLDVIAHVIDGAVRGIPLMSANQRRDLTSLWLSRSSAQDDRKKRLARLTPRETHVLLQLIQGKRVHDIATESFVSEATVRTQVKSILAKLGVSSQLAAVAMARDAGWGARRRSA